MIEASHAIVNGGMSVVAILLFALVLYVGYGIIERCVKGRLRREIDDT